MNPKYERQLKKGVLEMLVLKLLSKEKMYGFQLIQKLQLCNGKYFSLKEGTLYPILYRLEDDGLVKSEKIVNKPKELAKKYYVITGQGVEVLKELEILWKDFSKEVSKIMED
jgi:PadR family transcriptional regulator, regulatory protein PadR